MAEKTEIGNMFSAAATEIGSFFSNVGNTIKNSKLVAFAKDQTESFKTTDWSKMQNAGTTIANSTAVNPVKNIIVDAYNGMEIQASATDIFNKVKNYMVDKRNVGTDAYIAAGGGKKEIHNLGDVVSVSLGNLTAGVYSGLKVSEAVVYSIPDVIGGFVNSADKAISDLSDTLGEISDKYVPADTALGNTFKHIINAVRDNLAKYNDGISETTFGASMQKSWAGTSNSFLNYIASNTNAVKFKILKSTPLDSSENMTSLYGTMMLGCPYLSTNITDPRRRTTINTFVKDGRFLSLTPGLPKYNGNSFTQSGTDNIYNQTESPGEMISYLLKNGIDESFSVKDKRYYTFEAKYDDYYSYLETMLNTVWIKLGLANSNDNEFNIFSFFNIRQGDGNIDPSNTTLMSKYRSSIGFYCNASGAVSESISNSPTSIGGTLSGDVNNNSENYQKINYITGMGGGGAARNVMRTAAIGMQAGEDIKQQLSERFIKAKTFSGAVDNIFAKIAAGAAGAALDVAKIGATEDMGQWIQSFSVANGMKVVYPELWSDSTYSKSFSVSLSFTSPYGDPLSIFKYVYVPFLALLCFTLPRQASENGMVSPFFVRADIPGMATSDLAIISDMSWTKGGSNNLWTKDGLPRSIDVQLTIQDLYPYLAMSKRMSFLSANPSYTVFLDNMAGLCSVYESQGEDPLNKYWHSLINRVSGAHNFGDKLWNKFNSKKQTANIYAAEKTRESLTMNTDYRQIPWLHST